MNDDMKLTFTGVGGAFAELFEPARSPIIKGHSNMLFTAESGEIMAFDMGAYGLLQARDVGVTPMQIRNLIVSHGHCDHVGAMEIFSLAHYFMRKGQPKPKLILHEKLADENSNESLWTHFMRLGSRTLQNGVATLDTFYDVVSLQDNDSFKWEGWTFQLVQTVHVMSGYAIMPSYGLMFQRSSGEGKKYFISGDTQFNPEQLQDRYEEADWIWHDCETLPIDMRSRVHSHYNHMKVGMSDEIKARTSLYHYSDVPEDFDDSGFAELVTRGQEYVL